MSNRRRLRPPDTVRAWAKSYRCTDCDSDVGAPRQDTSGMWHVEVRHDQSCPVLNQQVSHVSAGLAASMAVADATGRRVAYLHLDQS